MSAIIGIPTVIEWAPDGYSLYFSSKLNDTTFYLYRTNHMEFIGDSSSADYSGDFSSDIDAGTLIRKTNKIRTTSLGLFKYPITSIAVAPGANSIVVTCGSYTNKLSTVYVSVGDVRLSTFNNTNTANFTSKNGTGLPLIPVYSSLIEMSNSNRVLVGTENGVYSTGDISVASPVWVKESGSGGNILPNVPVFQIKQQTLPNWNKYGDELASYNSGMIYLATHGRGIWSTDKYFTPFVIGIQETEKNIAAGLSMKLYPNPASDNTTVWFNNNNDGATYNITLIDISGRMVMQQKHEKLMAGEQWMPINTSSLNNGVYFVNISGSNNFNATSKLIITK